MKLLVDMNLSPRWASFLSDAGWEAAHWSTVGKADASDSEIMMFAAANGYVVLTNDLDFAAILAASHQKSQAWPRSALRTSAQMQLALKSLRRCGTCKPNWKQALY